MHKVFAHENGLHLQNEKPMADNLDEFNYINKTNRKEKSEFTVEARLVRRISGDVSSGNSLAMRCKGWNKPLTIRGPNQGSLQPNPTHLCGIETYAHTRPGAAGPAGALLGCRLGNRDNLERLHAALGIEDLLARTTKHFVN